MKLNEGLIKALAAGEIAVEHTGTRAELRYIISAAFPNDVKIGDMTSRFYFRHRTFDNQWDVAEVTDLPSFPVDYFFEGEFVKEKQPDIPEFERGELVVIKDQFIGDDEFLVGKYVAYIKNAKQPHVFTAKDADIDNPDFKFEIYVSSDVRKLDTKVNVTLQEIAKWKNCPVDQIVII